jgi:hypothetical protein
MNYGVCEVVALTPANRPIIEYRSTARGNWFEIQGIDRQFTDIRAALNHAAKNNL